MSPRTEEQYEEIRSGKRQLIMDTALELFALHGFESTTISQIARKADISKGLLYNYFRSKEDLLEAILNKGIDELMQIFDPNKDGILEVNELEYFIRESFRMIGENRVFWKLYMSVSLQPAVFKLVEKRILEIYKPVMLMMGEYFQKAGFKNPILETIIFGALLDGITLDYILQPDSFPLEQVKEELINRYCNQINKKL